MTDPTPQSAASACERSCDISEDLEVYRDKYYDLTTLKRHQGLSVNEAREGSLNVCRAEIAHCCEACGLTESRAESVVAAAADGIELALLEPGPGEPGFEDTPIEALRARCLSYGRDPAYDRAGGDEEKIAFIGCFHDVGEALGVDEITIRSATALYIDDPDRHRAYAAATLAVLENLIDETAKLDDIMMVMYERLVRQLEAGPDGPSVGPLN